MSRPVTIAFREDARDGGHVTVSVFIGRNPGARGRAGQIIMRIDEWDEFHELGLELLPPLSGTVLPAGERQ